MSEDAEIDPITFAEFHLAPASNLYRLYHPQIYIGYISSTKLHFVYLGAACLPLNVLENQTRARSSVPAKQRGEWGAALAAL